MGVTWGLGCEEGAAGGWDPEGEAGRAGGRPPCGCMGPVWQGSPKPHVGIRGTWACPYTVPTSQSSLMSLPGWGTGRQGKGWRGGHRGG